jgi:hypothetical protein
MKVLFLDIDGVLCTGRSHAVYGKEGGMWFEWDPLGCAAIQRACNKHVTIVVSSTWRHERHRADLLSQMEKHNLDRYMHQTDPYTPDMRCQRHPVHGGSMIRGDEINDWLARHPEVESYRILDDDADFHPDQEKRLIRTDPTDGMLFQNILDLLRWAGALKS